MRPYETTFILIPEMSEDEVKKTIDEYQAYIEEQKGEISKVENWGKRKLAYQIQKKESGYYGHIRFDAPAEIVANLERRYKLDESVIRYLTVLLSSKALKAEKLALENQEKEVNNS